MRKPKINVQQSTPETTVDPEVAAREKAELKRSRQLSLSELQAVLRGDTALRRRRLGISGPISVAQAVVNAVTGGAGGDSGGAGPSGSCPAPWTPILLAGEHTKRADQIVVGDVVRTQHEESLEWGDHPVTDVWRDEAERLSVKFADARELTCTPNHRVHVRHKGWTQINGLARGDVIDGDEPAIVDEIVPAPAGTVIKITVADAHTYVSAGVLSHNIKPLGGGR